MFKCPKPKVLSTKSTVFNATILGGTFDHLHIAHKGLISLTLDITDEAHICIMSDKWIKNKKYTEGIEDFQRRKKNVESYIEKIGGKEKTVICKIHDPYSYALTGINSKKVDSIVISQENVVLERTIELNEKRSNMGLKPLEIITMPIMKDMRGKIISSTRIRLGELVFPRSRLEYRITKKMRSDLKTPKGTLYKKIDDLPEPSKCVIAVGDIVTKTLSEAGYPISIGIIDKQSKREPVSAVSFYLGVEEGVFKAPIFIPALNPKGTLTYDAWLSVQLALAQEYPTIIRVYGEEDLLGFPATILAPKGSYVIYGDPFREGLVLIEVNEESKNRAIENLRKMISVIK